MNYGQITSTESMRELRERKKREGLKEINFYIPVALFDEIKRTTRQWKGFNQYVGDQLIEAYGGKGAASRFLKSLSPEVLARINAQSGNQMGSDFEVLHRLVIGGLRYLEGLSTGEITSPFTVKNRDAKPKASTARARASRPAERQAKK